MAEHALTEAAGTLVLGEYRYVVAYVTTSDGLRLAAKMANLAAPLVAGLRGKSDLMGSSFFTAISFLLQNAALGEQVLDIARVLATVTQVQLPDGKSRTLSDIFEAHFQGRYDALVKWLEFALERNLSSFFGILPDLFGRALDAAGGKSHSPSPSTKNG